MRLQFNYVSLSFFYTATYIRTLILTHSHICTHIYVYTYTHTHTHVCVCVCVCVCGVCFCVVTYISSVVVHKYMSVDVVVSPMHTRVFVFACMC